jgi:Short C-terminal domain
MFGPSRRVARRTARRTSRRQAAMYQSNEPEQEYAPEPAAPAEPDYTAELQKLAALKEQGIIDEAEFDAKKKQILGI